MTKTGKCLCGAVAYRGLGGEPHMHACHCTYCQRWSSGPFIGVRFSGGVEIDTPDAVNWYASSDWAQRGSCKICGTSMFYRLEADPQNIIVSAGTLEDAKSLPEIGEHIFIDSKPAYYDFTGDAPRVTGAEVFARFSGGGDEQ